MENNKCAPNTNSYVQERLKTFEAEILKIFNNQGRIEEEEERGGGTGD